MSSKRVLFFAIKYLFEAIMWSASSKRLVFNDAGGSEEIRNHYTTVIKNISRLQSSLKASVGVEKREKTDLSFLEMKAKQVK